MSIVGCCVCDIACGVVDATTTVFDAVASILESYVTNGAPLVQSELEEQTHIQCYMCSQDLPTSCFTTRQVSMGNKAKCQSCTQVYVRIPSIINALYHNKCAYCHRSNDKAPWLTREHLIPHSQSTPSNRYQIRLACVQCNQERADSMDYAPFVRLMATTPDLRRKVFDLPSHVDDTVVGSAIECILQRNVVNNKEAVVRCLRDLAKNRN